jgi:hypothetical protein
MRPAKKPIAIQKDPFALKNVPDMGGKERTNQGFNYGTALEFAGTGVQIMRGHVDAGGRLRPTKAPSNTSSMSSPEREGSLSWTKTAPRR